MSCLSSIGNIYIERSLVLTKWEEKHLFSALSRGHQCLFFLVWLQGVAVQCAAFRWAAQLSDHSPPSEKTVGLRPGDDQLNIMAGGSLQLPQSSHQGCRELFSEGSKSSRKFMILTLINADSTLSHTSVKR